MADPIDLQKTLTDALSQAVRGLVRTRSDGHWGTTRSTALVAWALAELSKNEFVFIDRTELITSMVQKSLRWVDRQAVVDKEGTSWDSEAWDTSLAIVAFAAANQFTEKTTAAVEWLRKNSCLYCHVWYHEVWETTLSAVALLRAEGCRSGTPRRLAPEVRQILAWFNKIPTKPTGEFINPHYSGFIVWLRAEIIACKLEEELSRGPGDEYRLFTEITERTEGWLLGAGLANEAGLWTHYTFANGYIAYALSRLAGNDKASMAYVQPSLVWFNQEQDREGGFEDAEDTALAVLAMSAMAQRWKLPASLRLADLATPRVRCFVAYARAARPLFLDLKEFITKNVEGVDLEDWGEFPRGSILSEQLRRVGEECRAAIILVTKDDLQQQGGTEAYVPRSNVVFEAGLFEGKLGWLRTLLIVEADAHQPSDWQGVIYIPLRDRNILSEIHTDLRNALTRIVRESDEA